MIPTSISVLVLAGASFLAGWLKDVQLPMWANGLIDLGAFLVAAVIIVVVNGGFNGDLSANLTLFLGACAGIYALLFPVQSHAVSALRSPLVRRARLVRRMRGRPMATTPAVPPRASRLSQRDVDPSDDTMPVQALPILPQRQKTVIPADPQLRPRRPQRAVDGSDGADTAELPSVPPGQSEQPQSSIEEA